MHAVHRPHLPRLVSVTIVAAILAIVISLGLATSLSTISQPGDAIGTPAHHATPALTSTLHASAPGWASNPFANLISRPLPPPWPAARP
jgi:hypothetical protein